MNKNIKNYEEYMEAVKNSNPEEIMELAKYDFSNDEASENYINLDNDSIEKFFVYMALARESNYTKECKEKNYKCNIDPDNQSKILQEIYKLLWKQENLNECYKDKDVKADTMNSVNTTLDVLFEKYIETKEEKQERGRNNVSIKYILDIYSKDKETLKNKLKSVKGLENFLGIYHTLGNFLPFPKGCNCPKGITPLNDYVDLTLKRIYDYYTQKEKYNINTVFNEETIKIINIIKQSKICEIVDSREDTITIGPFILFGKWLDSFKDWDDFVEKNYLQSFVENKEKVYGKPKELWKGHFEGETLPETLEQCEEYFINASKWIEERGKNMIEKLKSDLYN